MKLFINLANGSENTCLTIDCTSFNANDPGRFRTKAENPDSQTCFFNVADDDVLCNVLVSNPINKTSDNPEIYFQIDSLKSQTNNETFSAETELDSLPDNGSTDAGSSQLGFGIYDSRDERFIRKSRFKSARKSAKPKCLLGR